jgi:hypothetical protein
MLGTLKGAYIELIDIGPELMQYYDPIARHCERGEAERGNLKSTPTAAT